LIQTGQLLRRILPYLRPYRWLAALSILLMLLGVVVSLAEPWPLAFLIDGVLADRPPPRLLTGWLGDGKYPLIVFAVIAGLVVTLFTNGVSVLTDYVNTKLDQRMVLDLRSDMFANAQRLSLSYHDERRTGAFSMQINYQASALGNIVVAIPPLAQSLLTLVGMFWVALHLDAVLALIALTVTPFIYYSTAFYSSRIQPQLLRVRGMEGHSLTIVHEAMAMLRVIVAFRRERYEHRRFRT